jgi:predicted Rossmann fold flavoprotein
MPMAEEIPDQPRTSSYDIVILGAGAAGLMCALTAAQRGRRVLLLEKSNKVGKKILMSGGGRCNFTNYHVTADNFISGNPHFCKSALTRYSQWDFISLVEKHSIEYEERKHGQLFCIDSAREILAMLLRECESAGVETLTHCEINKVAAPASQNGQRRYQLSGKLSRKESTSTITLACESLVIASGALSIPTLGGSGMGYDIAQQFGLEVTQRRAGLVPFMFSDALKPACARMAGLATEIEISCNGQSFRENMLFTHRGISGPAILQISNYWHPGDEIFIDLLPGINCENWLLESKHQNVRSTLRNLLGQKLPKALANELQSLWWPELADVPLAQFSDKKLREVGNHLSKWRLKPSATEGYRTAEVTLGGVSTDSISSKTMAVKQQPGLYFIGEVLDVTGHLGGFNFQWAWSSGFSAGLDV